MLKKISPLLSPELLKVLMEMGHSDQIVIADANFPAANLAKTLIRADGVNANELVDAILSVLPLDTYKECAISLMQHGNEVATPDIWSDFKITVEKYKEPYTVQFLERIDFYEAAKKSYAIVATGEKQLYANIILTKGVL